MLDINKIPRSYFLFGVGLLIIILIVITVAQPSNFAFKDNTDYKARIRQAEIERESYNKLLSSIEVSPAQSEAVLKKIATEDIVKEQVNEAFKTSQTIIVPEITDSEIKISPRGEREDVIEYFNNTGTLITDYKERTDFASQIVFTDYQDNKTIAKAEADTRSVVNQLKQVSVPKEVASYHKAQIIALNQYASFLQTAQNYKVNLTTEQFSPRGPNYKEPWPEVYRDYAIVNTKASIINNEAKRLDQKFALSNEPFVLNKTKATHLTFIKEAHAIFGFGDLSITIGDIPSLVLYGVKQGLVKAFSTFIIKSIDNLVAKIDKYFTITSQLYYSQELGKLYTKEYWKKFDISKADQNILSNFLPEYFCVPQNADQLKQLGDIYKAKSKQLLKYDIKTIALDSPNFYEALAELGSAAQVNPEVYWSDYYSALAGKTQAAASDAANKEITSSGVKSGRDLIKGTVDKTLSKIMGVQQGSVNEALNLGNSNADSLVSTLIAGIFENLTSKFIFTAISGAGFGKGLAVVEEQPICLSTAKYKPVVPGEVSKEDIEANEQTQIEACKNLLKAASNLPRADIPNLELVTDCEKKAGVPVGSTGTTTSPPTGNANTGGGG